MQNLMRKFGGFLVKNSPTILTSFGVGGLITTTVMAVRATPRALQILAEEQIRRKDEGLTQEFELIPPMDVVKLTWKEYIPAGIMGVMTVVCIISANSINLRRNAAIAGLYSLSEVALKEYQAKVVETLGENKHRAIKDEVAKDKILHTQVVERDVIFTGYGDTLCFDSMCGRYFKSDIEHIKRTLNDLSRDLLSEMSMTLNQVYYELGLKGTKLGEMAEFHIDNGSIEPSFSSALTDDGRPCLVLDFVDEPRYIYRD